MKILYIGIATIILVRFSLVTSQAIEDDIVDISNEILKIDSEKNTVDVVEVSTYVDENFITMGVTLENYSDSDIIYGALLRLFQGSPFLFAENVKISIENRELSLSLRNKNINENCYDIVLRNNLKNKHYLIVTIPRSVLNGVSCSNGKLRISIPYRKLGAKSSNGWAVSEEVWIPWEKTAKKEKP